MKIKIEDLKLKQQLLLKIDLTVNDKLTYSVKRLLQRMERTMKPTFEDVQELIADFTIGQAAVDENGILIQENDKHIFTPEARRAILKFVTKQTKVFDGTELDIEPYLIPDATVPGFQRLTAVFDDFDMEELTGLLF
jgi:hypothetical protein